MQKYQKQYMKLEKEELDEKYMKTIDMLDEVNDQFKLQKQVIDIL